MKIFKKLLVLIITICLFNFILLVKASTPNLEVYYYNDNVELDFIELELYDLEDNFLSSFIKNESFINDSKWHYFLLENFTYKEEKYLLKVLLLEDDTILTYELTLDKAIKEHNYIYYLKENTLKTTFESLSPSVTYATFISKNVIKFKTNFKITADEINFLKEDVYVDDYEFKEISSQYFITIENDLNFNTNYYIELIPLGGFTPKSFPVRFDEVYDENFFKNAYYYNKNDLGATYTANETIFKVWAPTQKEITLNIYNERNVKESLQMKQEEFGLFSYTKKGNLKNHEYTYSFIHNQQRHEIIDPYAKYLNADETRALIIDLNSTNPYSFNIWHPIIPSDSYNDFIIYESSVKHLTNKLEPERFKNTYKGLTENNLYINVVTNSYKTGIDHLKELGITHLTLSDLIKTKNSLSIVNSDYKTNKSVTSDIKELKEAIKILNANGINVVLDLNLHNQPIVSLETLMPGYFYETIDGQIIKDSNNSALFETNHLMVNNYINNQIMYLINEFKFSGLKLTPLNSLNIHYLNKLWEDIKDYEEDFLFYGDFKDFTLKETTNKLTTKTLEQVSPIGFTNEERLNLDDENFLTSTNDNDLKGYILSSWTSTFNTTSPEQSFKRTSDYSDLGSDFHRQIKALSFLSYGIPVIKGGEEIGLYNREFLSYEYKFFNASTLTLYKDLIHFRKQHPSLKFKDHIFLKDNVIYDVVDNVVFYRVINSNDLYPDMIIIHNFGDTVNFLLPEGLPNKSHYNRDGDFNWQVGFDSLNYYPLKRSFNGNSNIELQKNQSIVLHFGLNKDNIVEEPIPTPKPPVSKNILVYLVLSGSIIIIGGIAGIFFILRSTYKDDINL